MSEPTFDKDGEYDLRTLPKRAAAMKHALRRITTTYYQNVTQASSRTLAQVLMIAMPLLPKLEEAEKLEREALAKTMRKISGDET